MLGFFDRVLATLIQYGGSVNVNGRWHPGDPVESTIEIIAPQPITGRELLFIPEGERVRRHMKTWTIADVKTKTNNQRADQIRYGGSTFDVSITENWEDGPFKKVVLMEAEG